MITRLFADIFVLMRTPMHLRFPSVGRNISTLFDRARARHHDHYSQ